MLRTIIKANNSRGWCLLGCSGASSDKAECGGCCWGECCHVGILCCLWIKQNWCRRQTYPDNIDCSSCPWCPIAQTHCLTYPNPLCLPQPFWPSILFAGHVASQTAWWCEWHWVPWRWLCGAFPDQPDSHPPSKTKLGQDGNHHQHANT